MNGFTKQLAASALGALILMGLVYSGSANAAFRDAGAKARGEFGKGFYNPRSKRSISTDYARPLTRPLAATRYLERVEARLPAMPATVATATNAEVADLAIRSENAAPTTVTSPLRVGRVRMDADRSYRMAKSKRNHIYRKLHPGTGFWN